MTPSSRIRCANDAPVRPERELVLYWMIAARRTRWSFGLQRAVERSRELGRPLLVLEALRAGYRWASHRHHRFVMDGMRDNLEALEPTPVGYYPYVESEPGEGSGLLEALASRACCVVTDEFPAFFLPRMVRTAARRLDVSLEVVDSTGLLPLSSAGRAYSRAYDFRRFLQRCLGEHLEDMPEPDPITGIRLPRFTGSLEDVRTRWPCAGAERLRSREALAAIAVDPSVPPARLRGGSRAGGRRLDEWVEHGLGRYSVARNDPLDGASSGLSPYLHYGHVGAHQVLARVAERESWSPLRLGDGADGKRRGWWGASEPAEAFLDQVVTWRELGYGFCAEREDFTSYDSLPEWARDTLQRHRRDPRPYLYDFEAFDDAATHDDLWNAAQNELRRAGTMPNYLRMLWGKKILHWSPGPRRALDVMIELNNRYALDGRDPNSYSGIFWVLGRFDRAWGPERPVFGKVRYMSSRNTRRKLRVRGYLDRWAPRRREGGAGQGGGSRE